MDEGAIARGLGRGGEVDRRATPGRWLVATVRHGSGCVRHGPRAVRAPPRRRGRRFSRGVSARCAPPPRHAAPRWLMVCADSVVPVPTVLRKRLPVRSQPVDLGGGIELGHDLVAIDSPRARCFAMKFLTAAAIALTLSPAFAQSG